MIESPRMDDEIIYSWCFNSIECFDSTPSTAIIFFGRKLGELVEPQIPAALLGYKVDKISKILIKKSSTM